MPRNPEQFGYVICSDTVNPGYRIVPLGAKVDYFYEEIGVANPASIIKGEIEQEGFSATLKRDRENKIIGFTLMARGKADPETARLLDGYFSSVEEGVGKKIQELISPLVSTCFISHVDGIIVQRKKETGFVLKRIGGGKLRAKPYPMFTQDGNMVESWTNFKKDPPEFGYEIADFMLDNERHMEIVSGVRFPQIEFKNMFHYFSTLLARGEMTEAAIREYVDPFIRARVILGDESR